MIDWDALGKKIQDRPPRTPPQKPQNGIERGEKDNNGAFGAGKGGVSRKIFPTDDANRLLAELDLRNVRPWTESRGSPRRAQKPPGPQATAAPEAAKSDNGQAPAPPQGQRAQGAAVKAPVPGTLRWHLLPCTLVRVVLQLDAGGALTWQAGQFDDNVRALCEEHGPRIRAFLSTLPGHRWESWQENALDLADQWEAGQGPRQEGQRHD